MIKPLRVGIVGCGGAGKAHYWRFQKTPGATVEAMFDPKPERVAEFFQRNHVARPPHVTDDWEEFLSRGDLEVVSICSPDHEHARQALDCLNCGLHALVEKPMATSSADAARMIAAAKAANRKLMVHHQMRYLPTFRAAKKCADAGDIGKIFAAEGDYYHDMRVRAVMHDNWRMKPESGHNIVFGGACHPLDLVQWATGVRIEEVFATANHQAFPTFPDVDTVVAVLKFSSGAIGRMTMTIGCNRPSEHTLTLMGDGGTLVNGLLLRTERNERGSIIPKLPSLSRRAVLRLNRQFKLLSAHESRVIHRATESLNWWQRFLGWLVSRGGNLFYYPYTLNEHGRACEHLIADFLDCVRNDTPPPISVEDSLDAIRVCEAVIASYRSGAPVKVKRD